MNAADLTHDMGEVSRMQDAAYARFSVLSHLRVQSGHDTGKTLRNDGWRTSPALAGEAAERRG
jgi:hypothetical protein